MRSLVAALISLAVACTVLDSVDGYAGETASNDDGSDAAACGSSEKLCDGVCVDVNDPAHGCASSTCAPCNLPQAEASCENGACTVGACAPGHADCNGQVFDGCETELGTSLHCADCDDTCTGAHGTASCEGGTCKMTGCDALRDDCDGLVENGCEADLATTGTCGNCRTKCKSSFFCNLTSNGYLCACPTNGACGNGGTCFLGVCVCGAACGIGQSCVAPNTCG